jgi:hypothetical protein
VTYRDNREADQAYIHSLEGELAAAKKRIAELEGKQEQALVVATPAGNASKWLGAPTQLEFERTFEGAFPADRFEELVEQLRELTRDRGRTELLKSSVAWWSSSSERSTGPFTCVTVTVKDGRTILRVTDKLTNLAGGVFGGIGGGVGGGGIIAPIGATIAMPVLAPFVFGAWFGAAYLFARTVYKKAAKKRAQKLQQIFGAVEAAVARELKSPVELATEETREGLPGSRERLLAGETA